MDSRLSAMLNPQSIAIVGASEKMNYGGRFMQNLLRQGYKGKIYPINPNHETLFGIVCYPSLTAISESVDLVIIIVKAELADVVLGQCEMIGARAVLIISAGFREQGTEEGTDRELRISQWSQRTGIPVCGPNCLGIASSASRLWACSASSLGADQLPEEGSVGLISHSGATAFGPLLNKGKDWGLSYRYIVSTGNEASVSMIDFADTMLDDPEIKALMMFIEGIRDGEAFVRLAEKALRLGKPLIALKIGESEVGRKAAASHTASMTGNQQVFEALCRQKGILLAKDYDEMIGLAKLAVYGRLMVGDRFAVLSHSGGIGGLVGDKLGSVQLQVPSFKESTRASIQQMLTGFGIVSNPMDLSGVMQTEKLQGILECLEQEEDVDGFVIATHVKPAIIELLGRFNRRFTKPLYWVWTGSVEDPVLADIRQESLPVFHSADLLAGLVKRFTYFHRLRQETYPETVSGIYRETGPLAAASLPSGWEQSRSLIASVTSNTLTEVEGKRLLSLLGIGVPDSRCIHAQEELEAGLRDLPLQKKRYAAKIISDRIVHKSDRGGVALNLGSVEELKAFFNQQVAGAPEQDAITGMLVEEMIDDKAELIIGTISDEQFGPVMMVGMGGIYTELFQLASWRVAPVSRMEARRMIGEVKGLTAYLQGYRGTPARDLEALIDVIERLSLWVYEHRDLVSGVEINPLAVLREGCGVKALDCVVTLR